MFPEMLTPLFESHGYALYELYIKFAPKTFTQWGYVVNCPDQSFSVFTDKISALQYMGQSLNGKNDNRVLVPAAERILQEDMTSSPSTSSFITTD